MLSSFVASSDIAPVSRSVLESGISSFGGKLELEMSPEDGCECVDDSEDFDVEALIAG